MSRTSSWSWKDVKPASDARRRLYLHVDRRTYEWLQQVAREQNGKMSSVAESILKDVAADDIAAHGGEC